MTFKWKSEGWAGASQAYKCVVFRPTEHLGEGLLCVIKKKEETERGGGNREKGESDWNIVKKRKIGARWDWDFLFSWKQFFVGIFARENYASSRPGIDNLFYKSQRVNMIVFEDHTVTVTYSSSFFKTPLRKCAALLDSRSASWICPAGLGLLTLVLIYWYVSTYG